MILFPTYQYDESSSRYTQPSSAFDTTIMYTIITKNKAKGYPMFHYIQVFDYSVKRITAYLKFKYY